MVGCPPDRRAGNSHLKRSSLFVIIEYARFIMSNKVDYFTCGYPASASASRSFSTRLDNNMLTSYKSKIGNETKT